MQELDEKQIEVLLKGISIPTQPKIVLDLMDLFKLPDPDSGKIVKLISADVALSAKMLKLANSPLFRASTKVDSINHALMRLGSKNFYNLVLVSSLQSTFKTRKEDQVLIDALWDHSLKIAKVCELIANESHELKGLAPPDLAYMTGLFHDCSIPLMLGKFDDYRDVFFLVLNNAMSIEMEDKQFSTNHALASYLMAKTWYLPVPVCRAILSHHDSVYEQKNGEVADKKLWAILGFAESLTPMKEEECFHRQEIIDDEWIFRHGTIIDELYLSEERMERLTAAIDRLVA